MNTKKIISALLCFVMLLGMFTLVGCGEKEYVRSELSHEKDKKMCLEVLNEIYNCRPGSAGSSIRCCSAAVSLLDWSHMSGLSEEEFEEILTEYLANADAELFAMCFESVDAQVRGIISREISRGEVTELTGKTPMFSSYELEVYELYAAVAKNVLG